MFTSSVEYGNFTRTLQSAKASFLTKIQKAKVRRGKAREFIVMLVGGL